MRFTQAITLALPAITAAYPVGQAVIVASDKRPEPGYKFQAPGPNDSRGPCPGLNLLANYGYLPRNGYVTYGQVLAATARGFNMGADLAVVLATFALLGSEDFNSLSFYLGFDKGGIGGLNPHSIVEADVCPNREDYYLGCGDNQHLYPRLFKQMVGFAAADPNKSFNMNIMSLGAFAFYPQFFPNGTYGEGGVPNAKSILTIIGAQYNFKKNEFTYVPERWPDNWYRRATPYSAVQALAEGLEAQLGTPNLNIQTVPCNIYMGLNSITPLALAGTEANTAKGVTWALSVLNPILSSTVLGCPASTLSPNVLFPNATQLGGPVNSPNVPSNANTGNKVYTKVYFGGSTAPTSPTCNNAS
ncbi:Cloroperoxidase [Clathrospora elynae]|uniref:Cloroperoxidase n=1 Tax=Clathrospora elynae TaxID=706981 RepID=A0A6A5SN34_9PLEO|nr:Cloroperoxidase [Clathrospora elynae]